MPEFTYLDMAPELLSGDLVAEEKARQLQWSLDSELETLLPPKLYEEEKAPPALDKMPPRERPSPLRELDSPFSLDTVHCGNCTELIQRIPSATTHLVITSPPYFQQRDYGSEDEIGSETALEDYLARLLQLFQECIRITTPDGSIVFNLGDKYRDSSLLLVPYRFAVAASALPGIRLVNNVTWVKQNPTPRQFRRRLVSSTEPFFHFVKSDAYYYDIDAYQSADAAAAAARRPSASANLGQSYVASIQNSDLTPEEKRAANTALREVIQEVRDGKIAGFRIKIRGVHAEAFGGQEGGRKIQMEKRGFTVIRLLGNKMKRDVIETPVETIKGGKHPAIYPVAIVREFLRLLTIPGDIVFDPFMGSGTTAVACKSMKRHYLGFEINPEYCDQARERIAATDASD